MTHYLTKDEVILFNAVNIKKYNRGEPIGIRDEGLLGSALERPKVTFGGEELYPTIFLKAAALFESLAQNHPFQNANKRTAFTALVVFLRINGYFLKLDHDTAVQYTLDVTNKVYTIEQSAALLDRHCTPKTTL